MLKRRWLWGAGAAVLVAVAVTAGVLLRPPEVDAFTVQSAPLVRTLQFSARVATLSRVDIGSTVTGRVTEVLVSEGAQVARAAVLVRLESDAGYSASPMALTSFNRMAPFTGCIRVRSSDWRCVCTNRPTSFSG